MRNVFSRLFLRHLSTKLIMTILLLLVFSISLTSSFYYSSSSAVIAKNVRASTKQSAQQSADYLSLILTVGSDIGQQIFRDSRIQEVIREERLGNLSIEQKYEMHETVNGIINNVMYTSSFVKSIYLLKEQGSSWGSGPLNFSKVKRYTLREHQWYLDVINNKKDDLWQPLHDDPFRGGGENSELVMSLVKPFRDLESGETLGVIMINLNGSLILEAIQRIQLGKTGRFFVIDPDGIVMIDANPAMRGQSIVDTPLGKRVMSDQASDLSEFEMDIEGTSTYVVTTKLKNDWTIIGTVPVHEIVGDIQKIQSTIWLYAVFFLLIASLIGLLFSNRITSPLKHLMRQMSLIEKSNFQARTQVKSVDEIGQLSHRFNRMAGQIETLIEEVHTEQSKKREAEIRALRYQINPHFLYNTLSSIRWMVKFNKAEEAYEGIASLVKLMEASMGKKGVFSTIKDELALLQTYMTIQRFRYGSSIGLQVRCEDELLEVLIPRMLLQPIVENAVFHGIAPKESDGEVHIRIRRLEEAYGVIEITIEDDGLGMNQDQLDRLLQFSSSEPKSGMFGIGLNHVHEMIQLYYGTHSGIRITSTPGVGTIVCLRLADKRGSQS
ncbi:sensor histidine kinase [Cohnella yongneupensis]|uniref:histidine kinase n=1 Tax=Cohnella yongneupensis TaxID=425006 RepID=A0ABW0R090_9BACL